MCQLQLPEEKRNTNLPDVLQSGQLQDLSENVQGRAQKSPKLLRAVLKIQGDLGWGGKRTHGHWQLAQPGRLRRGHAVRPGATRPLRPLHTLRSGCSGLFLALGKRPELTPPDGYTKIFRRHLPAYTDTTDGNNS